MMISGTWNFASINTFFTPEVPDQWDWAPIPMFKEGVGDYSYLLATGSTVSINANSKNIDAAVEVLNYMLSDAKKMLANAAGAGFGEFMLPMYFTEADFPEGTDPRIVRYFADFAKVTGEGRYGYTTWTFWPAKPNVQLWTDIELVWAGDETVEDYLAAQQAEWDTARADGTTLPIPKR
jgi:raffinose/stachyose/melibiose transport system substrate-binding protein